MAHKNFPQMANTYTQLNIHAVFSPLGRKNLLLKEFRPDLFKYMSGILKNMKMFPLAINGVEDHVHVLFELHPTRSVSDVMETLKGKSSLWINENHLLPQKFRWQKGYGAFSCSKDHRDRTIKYIVNQENHHQQQLFRKEYLLLLQEFQINYDPRYIFEFYE